HRAERDTAPLVDLRGDAESDRDDVLVQELAHRSLEPVEQGVFALDRRGVLLVSMNGAVAADESGQDLRPADVHTDHLGFQGRRLPKTAGCRPETSPTASTAAAARRAKL